MSEAIIVSSGDGIMNIVLNNPPMNPIGVILVVVTTLFPAYQLFSLPNVTDQVALFSQYLGLAALILMAWGQILSTRLRGIEALFGGLDRVYVLHKWAGIIAMVVVLLHDTIEDTTASYSEVSERFGEEVAMLVDGVTINAADEGSE